MSHPFFEVGISWIPVLNGQIQIVVIVPISQCHFENWKWWYSTLCQQSADIKKALFVRISHTACALARIYGHVRHVRPTREILLWNYTHLLSRKRIIIVKEQRRIYFLFLLFPNFSLLKIIHPSIHPSIPPSLHPSIPPSKERTYLSSLPPIYIVLTSTYELDACGNSFIHHTRLRDASLSVLSTLRAPYTIRSLSLS